MNMCVNLIAQIITTAGGEIMLHRDLNNHTSTDVAPMNNFSLRKFPPSEYQPFPHKFPTENFPNISAVKN